RDGHKALDIARRISDGLKRCERPPAKAQIPVLCSRWKASQEHYMPNRGFRWKSCTPSTQTKLPRSSSTAQKSSTLSVTQCTMSCLEFWKIYEPTVARVLWLSRASDERFLLV